MTQETKDAINRAYKAQQYIYDYELEGVSLSVDLSGDGCIHIWAHNRRNGKNKIHTKGFTLYRRDDKLWCTVGKAQKEYTTSVMLSKLSQFLGYDI